jgi:hypothetical protein
VYLHSHSQSETSAHRFLPPHQLRSDLLRSDLLCHKGILGCDRILRSLFSFWFGGQAITQVPLHHTLTLSRGECTQPLVSLCTSSTGGGGAIVVYMYGWQLWNIRISTAALGTAA